MIYISRGPSDRDGTCRHRETKEAAECGRNWFKGEDVAFKPVGDRSVPFCLKCADNMIGRKWAEWTKKNDEPLDSPNSLPLRRADESITLDQMRQLLEPLYSEIRELRSEVARLRVPEMASALRSPVLERPSRDYVPQTRPRTSAKATQEDLAAFGSDNSDEIPF